VISSFDKENHWKPVAVAFAVSSALFESSSIIVPTANPDKLISQIMFYYQRMQHLQLPPRTFI
jgi:hypothetical protein